MLVLARALMAFARARAVSKPAAFFLSHLASSAAADAGTAAAMSAGDADVVVVAVVVVVVVVASVFAVVVVAVVVVAPLEVAFDDEDTAFSFLATTASACAGSFPSSAAASSPSFADEEDGFSPSIVVSVGVPAEPLPLLLLRPFPG